MNQPFPMHSRINHPSRHCLRGPTQGPSQTWDRSFLYPCLGSVLSSPPKPPPEPPQITDQFGGCAAGAESVLQMSSFLVSPDMDTSGEHGASRFGALTFSDDTSPTAVTYNALVNASGRVRASPHTTFLGGSPPPPQALFNRRPW
jgi:hypothetical protein